MELKSKYVRKKEKLLRIDSPEEADQDIKKKKLHKFDSFKNKVSNSLKTLQSSIQFKEDEAFTPTIPSKSKEKSPIIKRSPNPNRIRSPSGASPTTRTMLGQSPTNHIKSSIEKKSAVIKSQPASKPLNFAELFGKSTTTHPQKKLTGAAIERMSPLNFDSINMDGLSPRLTAPGMANLLQNNSNHIAPSLSSFSNMGKTPRSELARKERINGLLSIFSPDFATKMTNMSEEKSLVKLEKSSENEKDESVPSIEWQGNGIGRALAPVKSKTFFDIGSIICEEAEVQEQEKVGRRSREFKEVKQKRTRSSSMGTLRAIHQEEILNKRDFPSLAGLRYFSLVQIILSTSL